MNAPAPDAHETPIADAVEAAECEAQKRLWLRAITPILQLRSHEPDPSDRVQFAFDLMHVAACERVARILDSDRPGAAP